MMGTIAASSGDRAAIVFLTETANSGLDISTEFGTSDGSYRDLRIIGTRMYFVDSASSTIKQYSLSVADDLSSTITYVGTSGNIGTVDRMKLSNDGSSMFCVDNGSTVYKYDLSTSYDISTLNTTASQSLTLPTTGSINSDFTMNHDGTALYFGYADSSNSSAPTIGVYELSTAYDLSTAGSLISTDLSSSTGAIGDFDYIYKNSSEYLVFTSGTEHETFRLSGTTWEYKGQSDLGSQSSIIWSTCDGDYVYSIGRSGGPTTYSWLLYQYLVSI